MKESVKRISTGVVFMLVLISVFLINNSMVDSIFVVLLSLIGIYEYNRCFKAKEYKPIPLVGYLSCFAIFLLDFQNINISKIIITCIPILLIVMFAYIVFKKLEVTIVDLAITAFSIIYVPFLFSFIKLLTLLPNGRIFALLAFASSVATDTFAYEVGSRFGKHKLCKVVSPKKSVEGAVAGVVGSMLACVVVSSLTNSYFGTDFNIILIAIAGVILSVVGQIGDLAASSIKRYCGQKDFSNILPGHGGILDRFDSVMFISPILYIIVYCLQII